MAKTQLSLSIIKTIKINLYLRQTAAKVEHKSSFIQRLYSTDYAENQESKITIHNERIYCSYHEWNYRF